MLQRYAITSDIHGCFAEFVALLEGVGFTISKGQIVPPADGRVLLFAGDLSDRGPDSPRCLLLMAELVRHGYARFAALGNHDERLLDALAGKELASHPLRSFTETLRQILRSDNPERVREAALEMLSAAPRFSVFHDQKFVVAHGAAYPTDLRKNADPLGPHLTRGVRSDEPDDRGRRVRTYEWVKKWRGHNYRVIIGHHPTPDRLPALMGRGKVIAIDTGCVFGGRLSALLLPERRFFTVRSSVRYDGDGPRGIQAPLQSPPAAKISRGRVTAARTARWQQLVDALARA